jgi:hypothetical protein
VPTPLGPHPARLLVLPVNEAGPALGAAAVAASREVLALLPPGTKVREGAGDTGRLHWWH